MSLISVSTEAQRNSSRGYSDDSCGDMMALLASFRFYGKNGLHVAIRREITLGHVNECAMQAEILGLPDRGIFQLMRDIDVERHRTALGSTFFECHFASSPDLRKTKTSLSMPPLPETAQAYRKLRRASSEPRYQNLRAAELPLPVAYDLPRAVNLRLSTGEINGNG